MAIFKKSPFLRGKPMCSHCGLLILKAREVEGKLHRTKDGKPICSSCMTKLSLCGKITYEEVAKKNQKRYEQDVERRVKILRKKEAVFVQEVALASQDRAAEIDPETKLKK